jgi:O-antigen ligase
LLHIVALPYTHNLPEAWSDLRQKSGLIFVPLAICCTDYINADTRRKLLSGLCIILSAASLYCLWIAFLHYWKTAETLQFFYHALVNPLRQHAVYFSLLVFIALAFLVESKLKNSLTFKLFLSAVLFLLSSKLVITFYLLYLFYLFILLIKKRTKSRVWLIGSLTLLIITSSLALVTRNPVSSRFYDVFTGDLTIIKQEKFDPGKYFNGLQFRLLQWKFTGEILNETNRWWYGVSPGDAQALLNQKYISKKMYTGDPAQSTTGFLGYNTHNQFLETLLQSGITGLVILLVICISLLRIAWQKRRRTVSTVILLLLAWLFSESVFETQFGIMIFTLFPLFFNLD